MDCDYVFVLFCFFWGFLVGFFFGGGGLDVFMWVSVNVCLFLLGFFLYLMVIFECYIIVYWNKGCVGRDWVCGLCCGILWFIDKGGLVVRLFLCV